MKKNTRQLIIALMIGILLFVLVFWFINNLVQENEQLKNGKTKEIIQYVVLKQDKEKGSIITKEDVELKTFAIKIEGAYDKIEDVENKKLVLNAKGNFPLTNRLFGESIKIKEAREGYRAINIKIAKDNLPLNFNPPCRIDIYNVENRLIIKDINVLEQKTQENSSTSLLVLEIPEEDVMDFLTVTAKGKLIVIKRNQNEFENYGFSYDMEDLGEDFEAPPIVENYPKIQEPKEKPIPQPQIVKKQETTIELIKGNHKEKVEF